MKISPLARTARLGFTLVELMVVIVIIAILMGVLMPNIARMREKGRRTVCATNLKQIHTLIETYMKDYDDCYPYFDVNGRGGSSRNAPMLIDEAENILIRRGFTKNLKVFQCPSRLAVGVTDKTRKSHFEYNPNLSFRSPSGDLGKAPRVLKGAQVQNPGNVRLGWDSDDEGVGGKGRGGNNYFDEADNHGADGGNVVYCDGHVQWWTSDKFDAKDQSDPDPENR